VCAALRARTSAHPVCLLSTGHTERHADPRRTSLPAAVEVAARAGLAGVVVDSSALSAVPETVAAARGRGLAVMTYGGANGDARWVARQAALGVHAAIVDDVEGVLRGLMQQEREEREQQQQQRQRQEAEMLFAAAQVAAVAMDEEEDTVMTAAVVN
jgi:hypothetical protein